MAEKGASRPSAMSGGGIVGGAAASAASGKSIAKTAGKQKPHDIALASILGNKMHMQKMWDAGELLSEGQKEALASLGQLTSEKRLPVEEWCNEEEQGSDEASGGSLAKKAVSVAELFQSLAEAEAMEIDSDLQDVTEHHARLKEMLALADSFLESLDSVDGSLKGLQEQHDAVVHKTSALHSECEQLLLEKTEMEALAAGIQSKLVHYDELEILQRTLSASSFQVGSAQFLPLLNKADEAITQLSATAHFADTNSYLNRFKALQARALTLVKQHVGTTLQSATERVHVHLKEAAVAAAQGQAPRHDASLAMYVQYQAAAEPIKALMVEIAKRAAWSAEYDHLLVECQQTYYKHRQQLLHDSITAKLQAAVASGDLRETIRRGCADLCDLCHKEYKLYQHFFPPIEGREALGSLLDPFFTRLVDAVRPLYLKTTDMNDLCSLVMILKSEILEDRVELRGESLYAMRPCIAMLLHEVQERLTFRAQIYIRDEIKSFSPSKEDIDYPSKLLTTPSKPQDPKQSDQKSRNNDHSQQKEGGSTISDSGNDGGKGEERREGYGRDGVHEEYSSWCLVLPRTLACLSQLYRTVDTKIFEGLAQDAVSSCTETLVACSRAISRAKGPADGQLFLVMHLLKLREQIVPFDIDFASTELELDFSDTRTALSKLVSSGSIFTWSSENALWKLAKAPPKVYHTLHNSKKDLEKELKHSCETFIMMCANQVADPLVSWVRKADALIPEGASARGGGAVREHAFANPDKVKEMLKNMKKAIQVFTSELVVKMEIYLPNSQTRNVLLTPIKTNIIDAYHRLHCYLLSEFQPEEYIALGVWSPEELSAALNSTPASHHAVDLPSPNQRAAVRPSVGSSNEMELSGGFLDGSQSPDKTPIQSSPAIPPLHMTESRTNHAADKSSSLEAHASHSSQSNGIESSSAKSQANGQSNTSTHMQPLDSLHHQQSSSASDQNKPSTSTPVASTPVASTPVASTPVTSIPVASTPVASIPVASTPVASIPVASSTSHHINATASNPSTSLPVASTSSEHHTATASIPAASRPPAAVAVAADQPSTYTRVDGLKADSHTGIHVVDTSSGSAQSGLTSGTSSMSEKRPSLTSDSVNASNQSRDPSSSSSSHATSRLPDAATTARTPATNAAAQEALQSNAPHIHGAFAPRGAGGVRLMATQSNTAHDNSGVQNIDSMQTAGTHVPSIPLHTPALGATQVASIAGSTLPLARDSTTLPFAGDSGVLVAMGSGVLGSAGGGQNGGSPVDIPYERDAGSALQVREARHSDIPGMHRGRPKGATAFAHAPSDAPLYAAHQQTDEAGESSSASRDSAPDHKHQAQDLPSTQGAASSQTGQTGQNGVKPAAVAPPAAAAASANSSKVFGGGQLPPGFVFENGELKYVGGKK